MPPKKGTNGGKSSPRKRTALHYSLRIKCAHRDYDDDGDSLSVTVQSKPRKKSKSQSWRDELKKKNPKKHKEVQQRANKYCQWYRIQCATAEETLKKRNLTAKEKDEAEIWASRKKRCNETARIRMNRMNERKREEQSLRGGSKPKKVQTRKQKDKVKKKGAEYKRQQRANYTPARKEAVLARRRELYAMKRENARQKVIAEQQKKMNEMEEKLRVMQEELNDRRQKISEENNSLPEEMALDLRSKGARQKAVERVRKSLPKKRQALINTTIDLIDKASPRKRIIMKEKIGQDPLSEGVMQAVEEGLRDTPKTSQKRRFLSSVFSSLKKHKLQRAASRRFNVSRKLLNNAQKRSCGRKQLSSATRKCIQEFYEVNSTPLPEKKFVSKKTMKPRHIMEMTISKLYQKYLKEHPDKPVSVGVFYSLRPRQVKKGQEAKYIGCLCEYCENVNLKIKAVNALKPGCFRDGYDLISQTMCPKLEGMKYHKPECIKRKCKNCGVQRINKVLESVEQNKEVTWTRWEQVTIKCYTQKGTQEVKKRKPVQKHGTCSTLLQELVNEAQSYAEHLFQKDWQNDMEKELISKLKTDEVLAVYDFAENYKCDHQREVQSAYYSHDSVTLHPAVLYYNCPTCLKSVRESVILVSDDLTHDFHLVNAFQQSVTKHLTQNRGLMISTFYRFSDGCSSQYKSRGPISDISYGKMDFGYKIHHNYSGTRHGKGASDGESGVIKKMASEAVKCGAATISTPEQLFTFLKENATKEAKDGRCCELFRRTVIYVPHDSVNRDRSRAIKTVPGTRKLHSIKTVRGGMVATRNLSCFCDMCIQGPNGDCKNRLYVEDWKIVNLNTNNEDSEEAEQHEDHPDTLIPPGSPATTKIQHELCIESPIHSESPSPPATFQDQLERNENAVNPSPPPPITSQDQCQVQLHAPNGDTVNGVIHCPRSEEVESDPPSTQPEKIRLKVNDYVAVVFSTPTTRASSKSTVYMAMVTAVIENQFKVKFMRRNSAGTYGYTQEPEAIHPIGDILQKMNEPCITTHGRAFVYEFDKDQVMELAAKFLLK